MYKIKLNTTETKRIPKGSNDGSRLVRYISQQAVEEAARH